MQVRIEDVGPCKKLLHIEVPPDKVRDKLDESYLELSQEVEIPGFRKGHAPRKLMEKRFGEAVNKDVHGTLVAESLEKALEGESLKMIGMPEAPEMPEDFSPEAPLAFDVTVEVEPVFEIPDYGKFELSRESEEITEEDRASAVERLRRRAATFVPAEDGEAQDDDMLLTDLAVIVEGSPIDRVEDANVRPAFCSVVGIPCAELPDKLRGMKAGDTRTIDVKLPKNYRHEEHAEKDAKIEIELKEVKRLELPDVNDDWAKSMRFDSLEEMQQMLEFSLGGEKRQAARAALEEQVCDQMVKAADFDLPEGPVERMVESSQRRQRLTLQTRNTPEDEIEVELAKTLDEAKENAVRECKLYFVLEAIAEDRHIFVTEDEVRQRLTQLAANYNKSFENVRAEMERDGSIDDLRRMMRRDKTMDYIISKAQVNDASGADSGDTANDKE